MTADPPDEPSASDADAASDRQVQTRPAADIPLGRLTPYERVIPTWPDSTVRRASEAICGPMSRHALVGRHRC